MLACLNTMWLLIYPVHTHTFTHMYIHVFMCVLNYLIVYAYTCVTMCVLNQLNLITNYNFYIAVFFYCWVIQASWYQIIKRSNSKSGIGKVSVGSQVCITPFDYVWVNSVLSTNDWVIWIDKNWFHLQKINHSRVNSFIF